MSVSTFVLTGSHTGSHLVQAVGSGVWSCEILSLRLWVEYQSNARYNSIGNCLWDNLGGVSVSTFVYTLNSLVPMLALLHLAVYAHKLVQ